MPSPHARLVIYRSLSLRPSQRWGWRLVVSGRTVACSGEGYAKLSWARAMGNRVTSGYYRGARLEVYRRRDLRRSQRWGWRLWRDGELVASSGEGYRDRTRAFTMGTNVRSGIYDGAVVVEPEARR